MKTQTYNAEAGSLIDYVMPLSEEWRKRRADGIGASEMGTLLGLNGKYKCRLELFHEKIGLKDPWFDYNKYTYWGRSLEDNIAYTWQYFENGENKYIENEAEQRILRKCRRVNGVVYHPDYPWMFCTLDREVEKDGNFNLITGQPIGDRSVLECKTLAYVASRQWIEAVPKTHVAQIFAQLVCTGFKYGELATLVMDTREFKISPIQYVEEQAKQMIAYSKHFWQNRVLPARALVKEMQEAQKNGDWQKAEIIQGEIDELEPDPESSEAYKEYMKERYRSEPTTIRGNDAVLQNAVAIEFYKKIDKKVKARQLYHENQLRHFMKSDEMIDFGNNGKVTYRDKSDGTRPLRTTGLTYPLTDDVDREFRKIREPII